MNINEYIIRLLEAGESPLSIRQQPGVSPSMVTYYRKKIGMPSFRRGRKPGKVIGPTARTVVMRASALKMKQDGKSYAAIGTALGVTRQMAQHLVRDARHL